MNSKGFAYHAGWLGDVARMQDDMGLRSRLVQSDSLGGGGRLVKGGVAGGSSDSTHSVSGR